MKHLKTEVCRLSFFFCLVAFAGGGMAADASASGRAVTGYAVSDPGEVGLPHASGKVVTGNVSHQPVNKPALAGVYIEPKLAYSSTQMDGMRGKMDIQDLGSGLSASDEGSLGSGSGDSVGVAFALGYDFKPKYDVPVRTEIEYAGFSDATAKKSHDAGFSGVVATIKQIHRIQTLFFNAYLDIETGTPVTPYIGAGIGVAFVNSRGKLAGSIGGREYDLLNTGSKSTTNAAWNIGGGLGFDLSDHVTLDLGYRFAGLGQAKTPTDYEIYPGIAAISGSLKTKNLYQHQVFAGLRFIF
ncbi:MAG: outer membrane beta-barrel protein [Desulfovibrio sp.]|jgi:opacity protein-like surface antigen|nr:outer membrane beta-barrel protein [Desulfovibrio sp.]